MRDFTLAKYRELCEAILKGYKPMTVKSYLMLNPSGSVVIMRHDVDRKPESALRMAELEREMGIKSTYYFRMKKGVFRKDIIKKIASMGHEIGYHYEVLDKAKGDFKKAIRIFEEELKAFRKIYDVKTICMHGNPLSKWVNRDLWSVYDFRNFDIIGEPYISINYKKVLYLTDTGRNWSTKFSVKDIVNVRSVLYENIKSTDDVIQVLNDGRIDQICISVHPNRWSRNFGEWLKEFMWQNIKNVGKIGIRLYDRSFR